MKHFMKTTVTNAWVLQFDNLRQYLNAHYKESGLPVITLGRDATYAIMRTGKLIKSQTDLLTEWRNKALADTVAKTKTDEQVQEDWKAIADKPVEIEYEPVAFDDIPKDAKLTEFYWSVLDPILKK